VERVTDVDLIEEVGASKNSQPLMIWHHDVAQMIGETMAETHRVIFYPVGNGDTTQIVLSKGRRILFDFCHRPNAEDPKTPEIDLKARLKDELKKASRTTSDIVSFTHADLDTSGLHRVRAALPADTRVTDASRSVSCGAAAMLTRKRLRMERRVPFSDRGATPVRG
jgi:hypothetical protein